MKKTDLLLGITSRIPDSNRHFFLMDVDTDNVKKIMEKVGKILFNKYKFGNVYLIRSGKGYHLINFSEKLTIDEYIKILKEMGADPKYIEWVDRVKYGVLRISRRSSHMKVPILEKVLISPHKKPENEFCKRIYFLLLSLERNIWDVVRVIVREKEDWWEND